MTMKTTTKPNQTKPEATATTAAVAEPGAQGAPIKASAAKAAKPKKNAPQAKQGARKAATTKTPAASKKPSPNKAAAPGSTRAGSKKAQVLDLLRRENGASLDEIVAATSWQRHTIRGLVSILGRTMKIESSKTDDGARRYRITGAR